MRCISTGHPYTSIPGRAFQYRNILSVIGTHAGYRRTDADYRRISDERKIGTGMNNHDNQKNDGGKISQFRTPVKKYTKGSKKSPLPLIAAIIVSLLVLAAFVVAILSAAGTINIFGGKKDNVTDKPQDSATQISSDSGSAGDGTSSGDSSGEDSGSGTSGIDYTFKDFSPEDIKKGALALISAEYEADIPKDSELVNIYAYKVQSYGLSSTNLYLTEDTVSALNSMMDAFETDTEISDVIVSNAFRSYADQEKYFNAGSSKTAPGHTDYHSGATFTLKVYRKGSGTLSLSDVSGDYMWIARNCYKYGFIQRYPADKADITGFKNEKWLFRYVGIPHATYISDYDLCLEEYLDELKNHPYSGEHLSVIDANDNQYDIYYVEGSANGITKVPVPENLPYTVSGNNMDGFIVTVDMGKVKAK